MNQGTLRAHVTIEGRVQGVFFRASTRDEARKLGVRGWVRNLPNGDVEALFEGDKASVTQMLAWCYKGSPYAVVHKVNVTYEPYVGDQESFLVTH
jgi:acylphosphatase